MKQRIVQQSGLRGLSPGDAPIAMLATLMPMPHGVGGQRYRRPMTKKPKTTKAPITTPDHRVCHHEPKVDRARAAKVKFPAYVTIGGSFQPPQGTLLLGIDRQPDGFTCGTETFQGICEFLRLPIADPDDDDIESYKKRLHTSWKYGTDPADIARVAREYLGISARVATLTVADLDLHTRNAQRYVDVLTAGKKPDKPLSIVMVTYQAYILPTHDKSIYFPEGKKGPRKVLSIRRHDGTIAWESDWSDGHWSAIARVVMPTRDKKVLQEIRAQIGNRPRADELERGVVILADPSNGEGLSFIPIPEFNARFHDTDRDDRPRFRHAGLVLTVPVRVLRAMQAATKKQGVPMFSTTVQNAVTYVP